MMEIESSGANRPAWSVVTKELANYYTSDYEMVPYDDDVVMKEIAQFYYDPDAASMRNSVRSKLDDFVTRTGAKGPGRSYVNIMGLYCFGDVGSKNNLYHDARRAELQDLYAQSIAIGVGQTLTEKGFTYREDGKYPTEEECLIGINLESLGSRGPFDNGNDTLAFKVEEDNLTDAVRTAQIDDNTITLFLAGLEVRRKLYAQSSGIHKSTVFEPWLYAQFNEANGTYSTFRGGINAAGDSFINFGQVKWVKWLHYHLPQLKVHKIHNSDEMYKVLRVKESIWLPNRESRARSELLERYYQEMVQKYTNSEAKYWVCENLSTYETDLEIRIDRLMHVDELVSWVLEDAFKDNKLTVYDYISDNKRFLVVNNLVRDQGSPYLYKVHQDGKRVYLEVYDRKARKYRQVEPINCFVQALLYAAGHEIIETAVTLPGRVGMQEPSVDLARMSQWSAEGFSKLLCAINVDLTRFDASWSCKLAIPVGLMYSSLYDDINMRQALSLLGLFSMDKFMILAKPFQGAGTAWDKYKHIDLPAIKSEKSSLISRAAKYTKNSQLRAEAESQLHRESKSDYKAVLVHIKDAWVNSGIYFTNTMESDGNQAVHTHVLPHWLCEQPEIQAIPTVYNALCKARDDYAMTAQTSGDDVTWMIPIEIIDKMGYDKFLPILAKGYNSIGWTLNWKKMSTVSYPIPYQGHEVNITPIEFLQWLYFQHPDKKKLDRHRKFLRALPALPYLERNSDLRLLDQYFNIDGRLNACLTLNEKDLDFAASVLINTGQSYKKLLNQRKLKPLRSEGVREYISTGDTYSYDPSCEASESPLLGLKNYFGFVKKYGDEFVSHLSRLSATSSIKEIKLTVDTLAKELETRAPHRRYMLKSILEAFAPEERKLLFGEYNLDTLPKQESVSEAFLKAIEKHRVIIEPLELPTEAKNGRGGFGPNEEKED